MRLETGISDHCYNTYTQYLPTIITLLSTLIILITYRVNGNKYRKFCKRCQAFKPARAHHCSICGRCIIKVRPYYTYIYVYHIISTTY